MPFTKDGIVPDIIMNPNAIPKRMTIAQLIECVFGKVGTIAGTELDATPFRKVTVENITEVMESMGYHGAGTEILYNGKTGEQMTAAIFMGPTFYYRLKHLVEDKQHCIDYKTEVLTEDGWKKHNELKITDKVATLKYGKILSYEEPLEIFDYPDHKGSMYYIKNNFIDMAVTGEHRMWISFDGINYDFAFAKDIVGKRVMYKKNAKYDDVDIYKKNIDDLFANTDSYETAFKIDADKIQQDALHAGYTCNVYHIFDRDVYICKLLREDLEKWIDVNTCEEKWVENQSIPVWCVHVSSEVFLTRRNGKVCWTGNSRATGPYQLLTLQPAEGRSRDGGFRFGEMERDCAWSHTPVALYCGLSIKIKDMENNKCEVLGWSKEDNGMIKSKQTNFMYKGERECIEITYEDGRKIKCTPEHPLLTTENEWIKAKDLIINESKVKASVNYPEINMQEEIAECNNWELQIGRILLKTDTNDNFMKALAFTRMLGYLTNDGGIYKLKDGYIGRVSLGHKLDIEGFLDDLNYFYDKDILKYYSNKNFYSIDLPKEFVENIIQLKGIITGKKVNQSAVLPDFIMDPSCPKPIVREFLAGMFGADGHTCYLGLHRGKRDILTSVSYSKSKNYEHIESLQKIMEDIKVLLGRFGIEKITIQNFKEISNSKRLNIDNEVNDKLNRNYELVLHLDIAELIPFHDKIGFRYCCHKSQRLEAGVSYKRLRNEVTRQHNWIVNRVDQITHFKEIKSKNPTKIVHTKDAIIRAVKELKEKEALMHDYAIPTTHDITDHLIKGTEFGKFTSKSFPTAEEFLKNIGALDWFLTDTEENKLYGVDRSMSSLPTMNLKVIDIRPAGVEKVYDIEVENTNSFLANGIVAHNCMLSHGSVQFLKERMFDNSDKYVVWIDNETGMISPVNPEKGIYKSLYSDNTTRFSKIQIPYSSKLLIQELQSMHINPRLMVAKK